MINYKLNDLRKQTNKLNMENLESKQRMFQAELYDPGEKPCTGAETYWINKIVRPSVKCLVWPQVKMGLGGGYDCQSRSSSTIGCGQSDGRTKDIGRIMTDEKAIGGMSDD